MRAGTVLGRARPSRTRRRGRIDHAGFSAATGASSARWPRRRRRTSAPLPRAAARRPPRSRGRGRGCGAAHRRAHRGPAYPHRSMTPAGALLLAPGAGADRDHHTLVAVAGGAWPRCPWPAWTSRTARRAGRPRTGPPSPSPRCGRRPRRCWRAAGVDPAGLVLGGRSFGGRMCSMAVAEGLPAAGLVLLSYPLHPPGKPEKLRTEHFAGPSTCPCLFVSGSKDPFGSSRGARGRHGGHPGAGHPRLAPGRARPPERRRGHRRRGPRLAGRAGLTASGGGVAAERQPPVVEGVDPATRASAAR